jgi:Leucine-rich repeat (LRR) protein
MANFVAASQANDEDVKLLLPVKKQLIWLKLGNTKISDGALPAVAQCTNLTQLHLNNTNISDKSLSMLKALTQLQTLNLTNTKVTAIGLTQLADLKKLQTVYLFGTLVKPGDYLQLKKLFPKTTIDTGGYTLPFISNDTVRVK